LLIKVDVIICTWNSNKIWFRKCIEAIKKEIPICHLIIVDRYSNDGTIELIKEYFSNAIIIQNKLNLAKARQEAIKYVDTNWFIFIDDDVEIEKDWFKNITKNITKKTGALNGLALPTSKWLRDRMLFSINSSLQKNIQLQKIVYLTNTLIRTSIVKDWVPPLFLTSGEDAHLSSYILAKGYKVKILYDLPVNHHGKWDLVSIKKKSWHYSGARLARYPIIKTKSLILNLFKSPFKGIYLSFKLNEPKNFFYEILSNYYILKGWLCWSKFQKFNR